MAPPIPAGNTSHRNRETIRPSQNSARTSPRPLRFGYPLRAPRSSPLQLPRRSPPRSPAAAWFESSAPLPFPRVKSVQAVWNYSLLFPCQLPPNRRPRKTPGPPQSKQPLGSNRPGRFFPMRRKGPSPARYSARSCAPAGSRPAERRRRVPIQAAQAR